MISTTIEFRNHIQKRVSLSLYRKSRQELPSRWLYTRKEEVAGI